MTDEYLQLPPLDLVGLLPHRRRSSPALEIQNTTKGHLIPVQENSLD